MEELYINEVAKKVGLSAKTIRFYETVGIIKPLPRKENGYRRFSERDIQRLCLVKHARDLGLSLEEIKNIVSKCIGKGCLEAREYVAARVPGYIKDIDVRLDQLQELKQELLALQKHYQESKEWVHSTDACCEILPVKVKG